MNRVFYILFQNSYKLIILNLKKYATLFIATNLIPKNEFITRIKNNNCLTVQE